MRKDIIGKHELSDILDQIGFSLALDQGLGLGFTKISGKGVNGQIE